MQTVIVNSGCANIASVKFAFERLGANVNVSSDLQEISKADRVILPVSYTHLRAHETDS